MINLQFGSNVVCLTLTESTTISDPIYLFEFINDLTQESICFLASDTSNFKERFNQFTIQLVSEQNENLLTGLIYLKDKGYYSYAVYQQNSTLNLNPDNALGLVEVGKVFYNFNEINSIELDANNEFIVYG
jgi:hypothetical protein